MRTNWKKWSEKIKNKIHYLDRQFTLVEWLVVILLAGLISIGIYKGVLWMILKSMTGSTFYLERMMG